MPDERRTDLESVPGDEAPPVTPSAGEDDCERCGGTGRRYGGDCPACGGTGRVVRAVGGG